jgi:hypothetical protein
VRTISAAGLVFALLTTSAYGFSEERLIPHAGAVEIALVVGAFCKKQSDAVVVSEVAARKRKVADLEAILSSGRCEFGERVVARTIGATGITLVYLLPNFHEYRWVFGSKR